MHIVAYIILWRLYPAPKAWKANANPEVKKDYICICYFEHFFCFLFRWTCTSESCTPRTGIFHKVHTAICDYLSFVKTLKPQVERIITDYCLRQEKKLEGLGGERQSEKNKGNREVIVQILNQGHFPMEVLFNQLMQLPFFFLFEFSQHTSICVQIVLASTQRWNRDMKSIKNPYSSSPLSDLQMRQSETVSAKSCNPMKNTSRIQSRNKGKAKVSLVC